MAVPETKIVTVYGSSDDLIEVEGDITEEYGHYSPDESEAVLLAFSDGTVLRVIYGDNGVWRITPECRGSAEYCKDEAPADDEDNYSDRVTLKGDVRWVVFGKEIAQAE